MRKIKIDLGNISLLIVSIIISIMILELFLRLFAPQTTRLDLEELSTKIFNDNEILAFSLKPNTTIQNNDFIHHEFNVSININSNGFRGKDFPVKKLVKERIMVIGDSMTFGHGVEDNETYPAILEKLLQRRFGNRFDVINGGVPAYALDQEYLSLKHAIQIYNPDIAIFGVFIGNDIYDINHNEWLMRDKSGLPSKLRSKRMYVDGNNRLRTIRSSEDLNYFYTLGIFLAENSHLYNLLKDRLHILNLLRTIHGTKFSCMYCDEYHIENQENWLKIEKIINGIAETAKNTNLEVIIMLIPTIEQVDNLLWEKYKEKIKAKNINLELPQNKFKQVLNSLDMDYIDLLPVFQKKNKNNSFYFPINEHWNERGNELAANEIYNHLEQVALI